MALTDKLTAIADAIRSKSGKSDKLTLDDMPNEIAQLSSEMLLKPTDYPDYVRKEVLRVANLARTKIKDESIVSICMSDSHYPASSEYESGKWDKGERTKSGVQHALMAIKALATILPIDFIAHLGDVAVENINGTTPIELFVQNLQEMCSMIMETTQNDIPVFMAVGNHDAGAYTTRGDNSDLLTPEFIFTNFTARANGIDNEKNDPGGGGYCYRDFEEKKVRVFLLNSCENSIRLGDPDNSIMPNAQQQWIIDSLNDLNTNEKIGNPEEWSFIVLCHFPLDYANMKSVSDIFKDYVEAGSKYGFTSNAATFIGQFHGHIHNFLTSQLYDSNKEQYDAWRICIPNAQSHRENYYGVTDGINYQEDISYGKTYQDTEDVSFVVNVINPSEKMIYSFTYGAGPKQRTIGYDFNKIQYNINFTSSNSSVSSSNPSTIVYDGSEYRTTLTPIEGYKLVKDNIVITMNNVDITNDDGILTFNADATSGEIVIPHVTGNIKISAYTNEAAYYVVTYNLTNINKSSTAVDKVLNEGVPTYKATFVPINDDLLINPYLTSVTMSGQTIPVTLVDNKYEIEITNVNGPIVIKIEAQKSNLWKFAESRTSTQIFNNGLGYINDRRLGGDGTDDPLDVDITPNQAEGWFTTGLIPYPYEGDVTIVSEMPPIRITNVTVDSSNPYMRAYRFHADKTGFNTVASGSVFDQAWDIEQIDNTYILSPNPTTWNDKRWDWGQGNTKATLYIRFCFLGDGKDVRVDIEGITDDPVKTYSITHNLNGLKLSNNATAIKENAEYTTQILDTSTYRLDGNPVVKMNQIDITSNTWNAESRTITIANVTGDIEITANAIEVQLTYDNLVADPDLNYGYTDGYVLKSSGIAAPENAAYTTTNFIPWTPHGGIIRLGGAVKFFETGSSSARLIFYDENQQPFILSDPYAYVALQGNWVVNGSSQTTGTVDTSEDTAFTFITDSPIYQNAKYFRISAEGKGEDMIVTINEPIS